MVEPEYQVLETNITRTTWQTVRRIINEILGVKGLIQTTPADSETELKGKIKKKNNAPFVLFRDALPGFIIVPLTSGSAVPTKVS